MAGLGKPSTIVTAIVAAAVGATISMVLTRSGIVGDGSTSSRGDGPPNLNGVWQALNEAHWDLEAHGARAGAVTQPGYVPFEDAAVPAAPVLALGSAGGVPASLGVVEDDGRIPYTAEAAAIKKQNAEHWIDRDPELKCYLPGIPRAMYMPYPFQIVQMANKFLMVFGYSNVSRYIQLEDHKEAPIDLWMGWSNGHWEGDTLVVDVTGFNGHSWLDRSGNFTSGSLHVVERYTPSSPTTMMYEATIEDPNVFTRPWKMSFPLYRRVERNVQLVDFRCVPFTEEFLYGSLAKKGTFVKKGS